MDNNAIIHNGREFYKNTKEYKRKKHKIIKKVNNEYDTLIKEEKNLFKKMSLILRKKNAIKKELEIIDSKAILFIKDSTTNK